MKRLGEGGPKFSIYGKIAEKNNDIKLKIPGPGEYKSLSTNPLGKYPISGIKNATNIIFGASKEKRFKYKSKIIKKFIDL